MKEFYNPYQFVPVKEFSHNTDHSNIRHDLWNSSKKSGRIICSLTLETPTVIGLIHHTKNDAGKTKKEDKKEVTLIEPATRLFGNKEEYYIPGNSIRGMTSSIAEAIT